MIPRDGLGFVGCLKGEWFVLDCHAWPSLSADTNHSVVVYQRRGVS